MISRDELDAAWKYCSNNRDAQGLCGCFHCEKTFDAAEIEEWIGDKDAICPRCGIDSVLPGACVRIDPEFLKAMYNRWFATGISSVCPR
jgi:hypothetical protein